MKTQFRLRVKLYTILFVLISLNGYGQVQIGQYIEGDSDHHGLGRAISLSEDGNTVAIGCWSIAQSVTNGGSVRVYGKKAGQWVQIGNTIAAEIRDESGRTISLSNNGTVLAIGARGNDGTGTDAGHVRVFKKMREASSPGGFNWEQIGGDIGGTQAGSLSGWDVSLSGDGNVVAIGAPFFNVDGYSNAGQVRVYKKDASDNWVQLGSDIEGRSKDEQLGMSVSLSDDGNTLAITASNIVNQIGHSLWETAGLITRVYKNDNGTWVKIGDDFTGYEGTLTRRWLGGYVRLTGDGNALVITGYSGGFVRVYKRDANDNWTLKGNELRGPFGYGIALSDDAKTLVVGTPDVWLNNLPGVGSVHIYKYSSNNIWQEVRRINGSHKGHELGDLNSLSLSKDGAIMAMGASDYGFDNTNGFNLIRGRAGMYHIGASGVSIQGAPAAVNTRAPFEVTFTFDRGVSEFNEEDIAVANATVGNFTAVDASTYTATVTPMSICGDDDDITINVHANSAFDINSNLYNLASREVVVKTGVVAVAKDITVELAPNGLATISPEEVDNGSGHNCDHGAAVTLSLDRDTFTCSDVGTPVTVTLTATSGNQTDISTAVVTVENNINSPVAIAKDITVQLNADGRASISPRQIDNGSGSGCTNTGTISLSLDKSVFTCQDVGTPVMVTLTAEQGTNTATATATVTVEASGNCESAAFTINAIADATLKENTVYTSVTPSLSGDDPKGNVTWTLGGTDAEAFSIDGSTGVVTMIARDFEVPADANADNVYEVSITATDSKSNSSETSWTVTVQDDPFETPPQESLSPMIPTAFTPNGDRANDTWIIDNLSEDATVRIYDRHGTILFRSDEGYTRPWDGTHRGHSLPAGPYLYLIQNGPHTYRGSVTILL